MEVLHRQAGDGQEQVRLQLGDDVLKRVFTKICQARSNEPPCAVA